LIGMHTIRLHGPWEYEPLARFVPGPDGELAEERHSLPPPGRMHFPADWRETLGADFRGRVRYTRRFHRPTGLDSGERVFLVVERVNRRGLVLLNGERLGEAALAGGPFRFDITEQLQPANLLTIEVEAPPAPATSECLGQGLIGSVRLEIE
jgi:hypothetical protein